MQIAYENVQLQHEIEDTQHEIVYRLSEAVEHRSTETGNHVKRVSYICYDLAKAYGLAEDEAEKLMFAAPLHDVGKVGIPAGKKGTDIHLYGRIVALADVYDALRHRRCYKTAWPLAQVLALIDSESGKQFEPKLVEIFKQRVDKLEAILQKYPDTQK